MAWNWFFLAIIIFYILLARAWLTFKVDYKIDLAPQKPHLINSS